jgi:hypothetical protein
MARFRAMAAVPDRLQSPGTEPPCRPPDAVPPKARKIDGDGCGRRQRWLATSRTAAVRLSQRGPFAPARGQSAATPMPRADDALPVVLIVADVTDAVAQHHFGSRKLTPRCKVKRIAAHLDGQHGAADGCDSGADPNPVNQRRANGNAGLQSAFSQLLRMRCFTKSAFGGASAMPRTTVNADRS